MEISVTMIIIKVYGLRWNSSYQISNKRVKTFLGAYPPIKNSTTNNKKIENLLHTPFATLPTANYTKLCLKKISISTIWTYNHTTSAYT
jgi:copper oxidase (laccase) domain-containing protein